ncbi:MAG TPA: TVP38/TMEM64 family protein [Desulfobacterales bacterium]|nr:TVP38/TMEM64 family protein [Desulfobacterales bacterium]
MPKLYRIMAPASSSNRYKFFFIFILCIALLLGYFYRVQLWEKITHYYFLFTNKDQIETFITSFGSGAPLVFILIQILQVLFAPIPGEATGFIGGYLFGVSKGFLYSSLGLTAGSWIIFVIGRLLGKRYVRKLIPIKQLNRFDLLVKRQGVVVLFLFFLIPGFPKDYLCFFLGLSDLPKKVFIVITAIGRMPGTYMLSLQGAFLYEQMYGLFALILGVWVLVALFAYRYRERLYRWIERFNNK